MTGLVPVIHVVKPPESFGLAGSGAAIGVGKALASPPSEPCWRFSRTRLSSRWFPHRGRLARYRTVDNVNSKKLRERSDSFDAVASADAMRSIRIDASARHSTGVVIPPARVSSGANLSAMSEFSCILPDISHPTSYLPSHRSVFASLSSPRSKSGIGAMKVLPPAALTPHGGSLRLLCLVFRTSSPQPRYGPEHRFRSRLNALGGACDPGFAMNEQGRRTQPPQRGRHPCSCSFASSCSPPRIAATQLPSATCATTSHRTDFHPPDKATSQTHSFPRKRESCGDATKRPTEPASCHGKP